MNSAGMNSAGMNSAGMISAGATVASVIAAGAREPRAAKRLAAVAADGSLLHLPRGALASRFVAGDLVVANDAATLPASLHGTHAASGEPVEIRLAGWMAPGDPSHFVALAFGAGDHRTRTEDRGSPPVLAPGDRLRLGPLAAIVVRLLDHPRLFELRFAGSRAAVLAGLARHGRPIQYAHVPDSLALWDVWTALAAVPVAFEPPSAGFALDWRMLAAWRRRGVGFATLTHAAGISSTGDLSLDMRLPFDEPYRIPERTAAAIARAKRAGGRIIAIGTTVLRALEAAADADGSVRAGDGVASGRIGEATRLRDRRRDPHRRPPARRKSLRIAARLRRRCRARPHFDGARPQRLPRPRIRRFHAAVAPGRPATGARNSRLAARAGHGPARLLVTRK